MVFILSRPAGRAAADAEPSARGTGLEGTFGTGTNAPSMADARWKQLYGMSAPTYSSSSSSFKPARMESASQTSAEIRDKYHCTHYAMKGSNTSASVCHIMLVSKFVGQACVRPKRAAWSAPSARLEMPSLA